MSNVPLPDRILQYGLTEVYTPPEAEVDVVFVHGLNGHPYNTWATHKPAVYWPADLLPLAVQDQKCRILTYGYDANVTAFTDGVSKDKIHNHAEHLASRLVANRALRRALERPIIFVCHSLGGLVVKRCLVYSESLRHSHTERLRSIYVSTYGILFLGTPHNGSDLAKWGTLLERISSAVLPKKFFDSSPQLVQALKTNNETLQNINRLFIEIIGRFHIYFFHESKPMDLKGTRDFVVDEDSAAPVIEGVERMGIERDHSHMCKFEDENAPGYDVVAEAIQRYAEEAPAIIKSRWEEEKQIRDFTKQGAAREMLGGDSMLVPGPPSAADNSAQPSRPISAVHSTTSMQLIEQQALDDRPPDVERGPRLVAPLGFRPNSRFVGFELELDELHEKLNNKKRIDIGSCSVLVWGQPGCGKTYLARQYLYKYRSEYQAGTFWADCRSQQSMLNSFWDIGISIGALGADEELTATATALDAFVDSVRKRLESKRGWLLIFDGLTLENDEEIESFGRFLPDQSGNSIIFTSVDRTLAKRHYLLDPSTIRIHPLSREEACILLYQTLGIEKPNSTQRSKALELVKDRQCLPLAIHAAAHALIETGRSLENYSHGVSDARISNPFLDIVAALRGKFHVGAVNLITILSFFSHYVPVALVRFGSKSLSDFQLSVLSAKRTDGARKDLDTTISILLRSGLLERTLQSYPLATPGKSSPVETRAISKTTNEHAVRSIENPQGATVLSHLNKNGYVDNMSSQALESDQSSTSSGTSTIDVLRMHSVVQRVIRDDLKDRRASSNRPENEEYWWWLTVAVHLLCQSFSTAHDRIKKRSGQGLVRDYREYETQAGGLLSFFPKESKGTSKELRKSRHQLREVLRMIRREIQNQSPSHSSDNSGRLFQGSIFERSSSTSEFGTHSPDSDLDRVSTWSLDSSRPASESPTAMQSESDFESKPYWTYDTDEAIELDSESGSEQSDTTELPNQVVREHSRRDSLLRTILEGKPQTGRKNKDLGEWKPLPAPPSISQPDVRVSGSGKPSRRSSSERPTRAISGSSEAEAALAAVHRSSPPASRGGGIRSPSREQTDRRQPLAVKSTNTQLSPLASEFQTGKIINEKDSSNMKYHARQASTSPRLVQALLNNQSRLSSLPSLQSPPVSYISPVTAASGQFVSTLPNSFRSAAPITLPTTIPSGYTSVPMSRNVSEETNVPSGTRPQTRQPQLDPNSAQSRAAFSDTGLTQRDLYERSQSLTRFQAQPYPPPRFLQTQEIEFGQLGEWARTEPASISTPITPVFPSFDTTMNNENRLPSAYSALQFGTMEPVTIEEARRRASEARDKSVDRGRRGAGGTVPRERK